MTFGKYITYLIFLALGAIVGFAAAGTAVEQPAHTADVVPLFSPGSTEEVVGLLESATRTLDVQMYYFSSTELKETIVRAHERGVRVRVLLEPRVAANLEAAQFFEEHGIEVRWASKEFANTHSKIAIADGERALVGSINFSQSALERNREAAVLLSGTLVLEYVRVFEDDWAAGNPT